MHITLLMFLLMSHFTLGLASLAFPNQQLACGEAGGENCISIAGDVETAANRTAVNESSGNIFGDAIGFIENLWGRISGLWFLIRTFFSFTYPVLAVDGQMVGGSIMGWLINGFQLIGSTLQIVVFYRLISSALGRSA